jgi:ATP synthase protein I
MAEDAGKQPPSSLDEFSKRLDAVRGAKTNAEETRAAGGQASGQAFRLSSELLAGILVGTLLGWGIDRLLGTTPWALVAGIFLGFAAGVLNVARAMKTARETASGTDEARDH